MTGSEVPGTVMQTSMPEQSEPQIDDMRVVLVTLETLAQLQVRAHKDFGVRKADIPTRFLLQTRFHA